jgi:membrane protein implicated in regulation of membrane protease activity
VAGLPLAGLLALLGSVKAGDEYLTPALGAWVPPAWAAPAAVAISAAIAALALWLAWRAIAKRSRLLQPGRFDLRVRRPQDLLGRDADVAEIRALIDAHQLVFLDGESGCGKSSLLAFGLVPNLKTDGSKLPVVIAEHLAVIGRPPQIGVTGCSKLGGRSFRTDASAWAEWALRTFKLGPDASRPDPSR